MTDYLSPTRIAQARADLAERALAAERGKFIDVDTARTLRANAITKSTDIIDRMSERIASRGAGQSAAVVESITREEAAVAIAELDAIDPLAL